MGRVMQVELTQDWRGYKAGAKFPMEVIGGGVADVLLRNKWARLLPGQDGSDQGDGCQAHDTDRDTSSNRTVDSGGSKSTVKHSRKRRQS